MKAVKLLGVSLLILTASACTAVKPDESFFASAEQAIARAENAGGDEHAPVEMRYAREKLAEARRGVETREYDVATFLLEQAEINAELAIAKTSSAEQRQKVTELRRALNTLEADFEATYGSEGNN